MTTDQFYSAPWTLARLHAGPLGPHIDGFADLLSRQGYAQASIQPQLRLVGDLSHWLQDQGLGVEDLTHEKVLEALEDFPRSQDFITRYRAVFGRLLEYLQKLGRVPVPKPEVDDSAIGRHLQEFEQYLKKERGLSQSIIDDYLPSIRRFLTERFGTGFLLLSELRPVDVTQFVLRHARDASHSVARLMVSALRGYLRFLYLRGDIVTELAAAVPAVARWRSSTFPKALEPGQVELLLASCDQDHAVEQRDYSILLLLARLGLRSGEVVAMRLADINWQSGELTIRGKGSRRHRLPIPQDVGEALASYLRDGRPQCLSRRVFIRAKAPHQGFASSVAICGIVRRALARAGLHPGRKGAHLLRHSLATEMLRKGASMSEIAQVLRHQRSSTTEIYAKVDLVALHELSQPWPGSKP